MAETTRKINIMVVPGLKLGEGDKVLINLGPGPWSDAEVQDVRDKLNERFPDVEFTFLGNVEQIAVQKAERPEPDSDLPDPGRVEKRGAI